MLQVRAGFTAKVILNSEQVLSFLLSTLLENFASQTPALFTDSVGGLVGIN